jgi:NAD(P)-dependent dehydrogenase (short-subunit alcohol dehydrogenase family)
MLESPSAAEFKIEYLSPFSPHVLFTHLLLPALKAAPEARIIHLSSMLQSVSLIDFDSFRGRKLYFVLAACAQSKLGNLLFSNELARRLPKTITSNAVNPGAVQSDIWRDLPRPVYKILKLILITPDRAAKLITKIALSAEWKGKSGEFKSAHGPLPFSRSCRNAELSCQLYQESCKLLNVTPI